MEMLVAHLAGLGHIRIGFVPGQPGFATTIERTGRFRNRLKRYELAEYPGYGAPGTHDVEAAVQCAAGLLALPEPPTGIVGKQPPDDRDVEGIAARRNEDFG